MKKILTILLAVMAMAVSAQAQRVAYLTQKVGYSYSEIRFELTDTNRVADVYIYWAVHNESFTLKDSLNSGFTSPDTFTVVGLLNGVMYDFYLMYVDTSGTDTTLSISLTHTTTTTNYIQTITDSDITHEGATITWGGVEGDTGTAKVRLYVYNVSDSLWAAGLVDSLVPRMTVLDTAIVIWDTTVVNPLNSDSVFLCFGTTRADVADYSEDWTDTSLGDSASASFAKSGLQPLTWHYFAGIVCSSDVYDSLDIDSLYTPALADSFIAVTGLEEGETYYYGTVALDSALTDSSAQGSFTTLDLTGTLSIVTSPTAQTTITITVTPNTSTDFNGVDSINLYEGTVADSLLDVATVTLAETLTIAFDTTAIIISDTVWFFWGTLRDSINVWSSVYLTDSTITGDTYSSEFISTGLGSATEYYYSAVVCSADVYDSIAIDSVTTTSLIAAFSRTGKFRGGQYHYWAEIWDSIYVDSTANDSISIPLIKTWETSNITLTWNNPSSMPSQTYSVDGIETVYYNCWMTGATFIAKDSVKLFVYDETWGLELAIDSSGFIVTDTVTIAVDSVACNNKDLIKFKMVARHPTTTDDIIGKLNMYIEIQDRPF